MFISQREKCEDSPIIALVELDVQKIRVRIVLGRDASRERIPEVPGNRQEKSNDRLVGETYLDAEMRPGAPRDQSRPKPLCDDSAAMA